MSNIALPPPPPAADLIAFPSPLPSPPFPPLPSLPPPSPFYYRRRTEVEREGFGSVRQRHGRAASVLVAAARPRSVVLWAQGTIRWCNMFYSYVNRFIGGVYRFIDWGPRYDPTTKRVHHYTYPVIDMQCGRKGARGLLDIITRVLITVIAPLSSFCQRCI